MVVDTSALIAILLEEPEAESFAAELGRAERLIISVASVLESSIVIERTYPGIGQASLDRFLSDLEFEIVPVTAEQVAVAREAYRKYGRGRHGLNFGDCFSYGLSKVSGEPLLYKGADFLETDVVAAISS